MNIDAKDALELDKLFRECGHTFQMCRIGEDTEGRRKMRLELEEPYAALAKKWDEVFEGLADAADDELLPESADDPLFGRLIYDDPRAGLRRCVNAKDPGEVYFYHGCYTDADHDECAKLERQDGTTCEAYWHKIRFVDVPQEATE